MDRIIKLVGSAVNDDIKRLCISLLSSVTDGVAHAELYRIDLIEVLINATRSTIVEMQDDAAFGLGNLAKDRVNKVEIIKLGGMDALTSCLSQSDPDVLLNSLRALDELFMDCMNKVEFRKIDGIKRIIHLIDSNYAEISIAAFTSILKLSNDDQVLVELKHIQFLQLVIKVLSSTSNDAILKLSFETLAKLSRNPDILKEIPFCFPTNMMVEAFNKDELKLEILHFISIAAEKRGENRLLVIESGLMPKIISLLSSTDHNLSSSSAQTLCHMVEDDRVIEELMKGINLEAIGKLLHSDDHSVKSAASLLINACVNHEKSQAQIKEIPALYTSIIAHIQSDDVSVVRNASQCICDLAKDGNHKSELIRAGLINILAHAIETQSQLFQVPTTLVLAIFMQEEEARSIILKSNSKIVEKLVDNVLSPVEELSRHSILALGNACKNDSICRIVSRLNAVDFLLLAIRNPIQNLVYVATDTLFRVIEQNATAKYWITNTLSDLNKVEDGFLDITYSGKYYHSLNHLPKWEELHKSDKISFHVDFKTDPDLETLLSQLSQSIQNKGVLEQFHLVAQIVVDKLGGLMSIEDLKKAVPIHISELKSDMHTSILKLGVLTIGSFYHRALLFKTLCDRLGIGPCSLTRSSSRMAWNSLEKSKLYTYPPTSDSRSDVTVKGTDDDFFVVDLMFKPGVLLSGIDAQDYINCHD